MPQPINLLELGAPLFAVTLSTLFFPHFYVYMITGCVIIA
jgi:hypothetical protein